MVQRILCLCFLSYFSSTLLMAQTIQWERYEGEAVSTPSTNAKKIGAALQQTGNDPTLWDYGNIKENSSGVRFFKCRNVGTTPLIITTIKTSCGCLVASTPKKIILPNEVAYIEVCLLYTSPSPRDRG